MIYLSEQLRALRRARDLTQEEVASALHVSPQSVSKWERGESYPDIELLPALANFYETSVDALIGMDRVRSDLMTDDRFGPKEAFRRAVANDIAAGRVSASVSAEEIAAVSMAIWDGLVQARIDHFLECDMGRTLAKAYGAIWRAMRVAAPA